MTTCNLLISHPNENMRRSMKRLISRMPGAHVLGTFSDTASLIDSVGKMAPDMVIIRIMTSDDFPVSIIDQLRQIKPDIGIIFMYTDKDYLDIVMENGANGYLLDRDLNIEFLSAISAVSQGESYVSSLIVPE